MVNRGLSMCHSNRNSILAFWKIIMRMCQFFIIFLMADVSMFDFVLFFRRRNVVVYILVDIFRAEISFQNSLNLFTTYLGNSISYYLRTFINTF